MNTQPIEAPRPSPDPYRPSWVDQVMTWIDRLPLPAWVVYLLFLLVMIVANNARTWLDGSAPPGSFDIPRITDGVYSVYFLALIHYLNGVAGRALARFRPLLDASDAEFQRLTYSLTVLPAGLGYVALLAGAALALGGILLDPLAFGLTSASPLFAWVYMVAVVTFNTALLVAFVLHGIRQLRLIDRLYARAAPVDMLNPAPLHALSAVTARTGLGVILFAWFMVVQDPTPGLNPVSIFGVTTLLLLGTASFVLPLSGMHERLVDEKNRLLAAVGRRLSVTFDLLHANVDTQNLDRTDKINQTIASLKAERDILAHLPTWPWQPETPRVFLTAVVLPVVVWVLTALLERLLES